MLIYKIIVTLLVLIILDRCIFPFYYNTLKDAAVVALVIFAIIVDDFQLFNQIMFFTIPILLLIVFIDSCLRSRLRYDEKQELEKRATSALFAAAHYQSLYEQLEEKYNELYNEKTLTYDRLCSAMRWLYTIKTEDDLEQKHSDIAVVLKGCIELYSQPPAEPVATANLFSDISNKHQVKHLIRELKRIKKDNTLGENFDLFIDNEIYFLEVALKNVDSRANSK